MKPLSPRFSPQCLGTSCLPSLSLLNQRPLLVDLKVVIYSHSLLIDRDSQSLNLGGRISMMLNMRFYRSENKRFFSPLFLQHIFNCLLNFRRVEYNTILEKRQWTENKRQCVLHICFIFYSPSMTSDCTDVCFSKVCSLSFFHVSSNLYQSH